MAFGDILHIYKASAASGEVTVNITTTPAVGSLLVFGVGRSATHSAGGSWGTPTNWNNILNSGINTGNMGAAWWYKIADGTETSVVTNGTNTQGNAQGFVVEFEGPFAAAPFDQVVENETNLSTAVTSQSTGTTGTTAQADELALAFFATVRFDTVDGGGTRNYTNSFTEAVATDTTAARAGGFLARKVLSATGTVECTFSVTDTGDEMYGSAATFKKQAAGGTTVKDIIGGYIPAAR